MNNENNIETEIKLTTVSQELLESVLYMPIIQERIVPDSEKDKYLESHYYDTPKRKFAKAGIVFRVRKEPEGFVATVKTEKANSGGLSERMEYNVDLPDEKPAFAGFSKINFLVDLKAIVDKDGPVEELFSVLVQRKQCNLALTQETVVEMAIDTGEIVAGEKRMPVCEIEFEIKHGNSKELIEFVALLAKEMPLFAEQKSKYYRGCELAGEKTELIKAVPASEISLAKPFKSSLQAALIKQTGYALSMVSDCVADKDKLSDLHEALGQLERMLSFSKTLFNEGECREQIKIIHTAISLLETCDLVERFSYKWQKLNKRTESIHSTLLLEKLLQEKSSYYENQVQDSLVGGKYSALLFSLWSWLEEENWQDNVEVSGKEYLYERISQINDEILSYYAKDDVMRIYEKVLDLHCGITVMKKFAGKDIKNFGKVAKKLLKNLENKVQAEKIAKVLFSLFRTSAGRLLYRDAGMLLGYYFNQYSIKANKIQKNLEEFKEAGSIFTIAGTDEKHNENEHEE